MTSLSRICLATALLAGAAAPALAQSNYNWKPYATGGYVGASIGRSDFQSDCGSASLFCDSTRTSGSIYTGTWVNPHLGLELGYLDMGKAQRNGGDTRARGINLSVVGQVPITNAFSAFGKIGTTYGRTETSATAPGVATGDASGWGLSYALGVAYDLTPQWALTLDWQRNRFNFAGGRDDVDATSLGVRYKF